MRSCWHQHLGGQPNFGEIGVGSWCYDWFHTPTLVKVLRIVFFHSCVSKKCDVVDKLTTSICPYVFVTAHFWPCYKFFFCAFAHASVFFSYPHFFWGLECHLTYHVILRICSILEYISARFFLAFLQVFCTDGNIFLLFQVLLVHFKDFLNDFYTVIRFSELFVIVGRFLRF